MQILNRESSRGFIKAWIDGVPLEENTKEQALDIASMPFIYKYVSLMPDAHLGTGSTVGSVIPTLGAVIPSAVGVDIGCGMIARQFDVNLSTRPSESELEHLHKQISKAIPHGRTNNGDDNDRGAWGEIHPMAYEQWYILENDSYKELIAKYPRLKRARTWKHMGTLGTGNHFIELNIDTKGKLWIMIHSGSRGIGAAIGNNFMMLAKEKCQDFYADRWLPHMDLSFFPEGSPQYDDYIMGMKWAQEYAWRNRLTMMDLATQAIASFIGKMRHVPLDEVHCAHNYAAWENHYGQNVLVTRKGAIRAREGDMGLVPGAMGKYSYVVRGLGNRESFTSASHGAGRVMSRKKAKATFTVDDHIQSTEGVVCDKTIGTIDETLGCYKDLDAVIQAEKDLIEVIETLHPLLVVKGIGEKRRRRGKQDPLEAGIDS